MKPSWHLICVALLALAGGCTTTAGRNPFLTLSEIVGASSAETGQGGGGSGQVLTAPFRRDMTLTFRNNHPGADLNVSFVAWVSPSSIRSAQQQDALLSGGFVQLTREVRLGTAATLPVGTFVYNGAGTAGATAVVLNQAAVSGAQGQQQTLTPTSSSFVLITPDAILAFTEPPVSCDSVAFIYTLNGQPLEDVPAGSPDAPFQGSTRRGSFKTLAMVDVYQCSPFRPGLYIRLSGGARAANEYVEGDNVAFDFNQVADADGNFANVTIGQ